MARYSFSTWDAVPRAVGMAGFAAPFSKFTRKAAASSRSAAGGSSPVVDHVQLQQAQHTAQSGHLLGDPHGMRPGPRWHSHFYWASLRMGMITGASSLGGSVAGDRFGTRVHSLSSVGTTSNASGIRSSNCLAAIFADIR